MDEICRLCCSTNFVNNFIFDEENALYLKMSLYLPIKVFKNDRLPQRVCDKCSCKVNDFYQFCNETIEVQKRLKALFIPTNVEIDEHIDLTLIKQDNLSPLPLSPALAELATDQKIEPSLGHSFSLTQSAKGSVLVSNSDSSRPVLDFKTETLSSLCDQSTQTEFEKPNLELPPPQDSTPQAFPNVKVKQEPESHFKTEDDDFAENLYTNNHESDSDDNITLSKFRKKKRSKKQNGVVQKKKKTKLKEWEMLMRALPEGTAVTVVDPPELADVKTEPGLLPAKRVKSEPVEYHCCICFVQCYSRAEMLEHYKDHAALVEDSCEAPPPAPPAPPAPDSGAVKCLRCQKKLSPAEWGGHWRAHWARDMRPFRCALCERTFRDHYQILKHGLSHKWGEEGDTAAPDKRFVCDLCPDGFVYMRHLLSHRMRAHPESAARALSLRCAACGRTFAHLNSLRRHLRAHSGERNFLCSVCGKALSSKEHLKFHLRIHTGYKPNVCKTCGKGFVKKCNLTLHERVHSGEKPHVCSHCGKAFSQRSTLVIHERYHSGARPYVCSLCGRGFVAKGLLSMHLKTTCI